NALNAKLDGEHDAHEQTKTDLDAAYQQSNTTAADLDRKSDEQQQTKTDLDAAYQQGNHTAEELAEARDKMEEQASVYFDALETVESEKYRDIDNLNNALNAKLDGEHDAHEQTKTDLNAAYQQSNTTAADRAAERKNDQQTKTDLEAPYQQDNHTAEELRSEERRVGKEASTNLDALEKEE